MRDLGIVHHLPGVKAGFRTTMPAVSELAIVASPVTAKAFYCETVLSIINLDNNNQTVGFPHPIDFT
jgi:hypothetical protein